MRSRSFVYSLIVALALSIAPLCTVLAQPAPDSFADLAEKLSPAVVNISTTQTVEGAVSMEDFLGLPPGTPSPFEGMPDALERLRPFMEQQEGPHKAQSLGSGFIVDPAGYIVTNNHVIEKSEEINVILSDNTTLQAKVVGRDTKLDLALLKVDAGKKLPFVRLGDSDAMRVGDWVIAIGNPFGLGGSVSAGIISARARDINAGPFDDFLQTDAAINRGNSGGPLFNTKGDVIGINTAIFSPSGGNVGIGFALPANMAIPVIKQLRESGKVVRGWLGVKIQTVSDDIAESLGIAKETGALVVEVTPGSPAATAGIRAGDVILRFGKNTVPTMRKLPRFVAETPIHSTVPISLLREGREQVVQVTIGVLKDDAENAAATEEQQPTTGLAAKGEAILGMQLSALNAALLKQYHLDGKTQGLLVLDVDKQSAAYEKGIRPGDMMIEAGQQKAGTVKDVQGAIARAKKEGRKAVLMLFLMRGDRTYVALPVK